MSAVITRSTGTPLPGSCLVAGGGYTGITPGLDAIVCEAARALARAYGQPVEIRYNSDRESGGAWLVTEDGYSAHVGIWAQVITANSRAAWERFARQSESELEAGRFEYGNRELTADDRAVLREDARQWRAALADNPYGALYVGAHITAVAAGSRTGELAQLPCWAPQSYPCISGAGYHHGRASSVAAALARCLEFAPTARTRDDVAQLAAWETDGGA